MGILNNKIVSLIATVSLVASVSVGFATVASATSIDESSAISVAEVTPSIGLVYDKASSTEKTRVYDLMVYGLDAISGMRINFTASKTGTVFDKATTIFVPAAGIEFDGANKVTISNNRLSLQLVATSAVGDNTVPASKSIGKFTIGLAEDDEFTMTWGMMKYSTSATGEVTCADEAYKGVTFTVPKYATKPDAQVVNATMKHSQNDELSTENEAQYWLAEFTPTAAFNTLTVVATDVDGNTTAPVSKTETMVSGESSMFVQVLVKNVTKAVQSVVVTASVE